MLLSHVPVFPLLFGLALASSRRPHRCVIPAAKDKTSDDSGAVNRVFAQCAQDAIIVFEEGVDYNIFTPISATNLSNVEIQVKGNLHLPQSIPQVQRIVNGTDRVPNSDGHTWFTFAGPQIDFVGSENINAGWIISYGQAWWDANPANGTGIASRPHLMSFQTTDGSMKYFKSRKPIAWNVKVKGDNIDISHAFIDAESDNDSFPFNTDGFDVSATNVRITDSVVYNGDDAIAVSDGSHNVVFKHNTIGYQSHGMSIGSLGSNAKSFNNVSDIHFEDVTVINAVYAARFKSWIGGQGLVKNVSWKNIRVYNVTFPIFVTQSYFNQGSSQTPRANNASVAMENFTWEDFTGTINTFNPGDGSCASDPCWYNVGLPDLKHTEAVIIECNTASSCTNFKLQNINLIPQNLAEPSVICINATDKLNPHLGFDCKNGTFVSS